MRRILLIGLCSMIEKIQGSGVEKKIGIIFLEPMAWNGGWGLIIVTQA